MKAVIAFVAAFIVSSGVHAQNMLSKAMHDCMRQGRPVLVGDMYKEDNLFFWYCEGLPAAALFSEMRGRSNEKPLANGGTVRWPGKGLSCSQAPSRAADCLISIELSKQLLDAMR
jgi:hypothetical protein